MDSYYESEYQSALSLGFQVCLISLEALLSNNINKALRRVPALVNIEVAIYRGWMIKPLIYEYLYSELLAKNIKLINSPEEYLNCHYFPRSYEIIKNKTPLSYWVDMRSLNESKKDNMLNAFGAKSILVKDYVKSRKHEWEETCFIPSATNKSQALQVINNFILR